MLDMLRRPQVTGRREGDMNGMYSILAFYFQMKKHIYVQILIIHTYNVVQIVF